MSSPRSEYRAAVIGHTGRGNYGHNLDIALVGLPMVRVVAIADPSEEGRAMAQQRTGAEATYADYRAMLKEERPDLVVVAPTWLDERVAMIVAAAEAGANLLVEKPIAASLSEADAILRACKRARVRIAVAHQGRLHPATLHAVGLIESGAIGRLRLIRAFGKMDQRGGEQDLITLGTHVLDLMRLFGGDATWASADLLVGSRLTSGNDGRIGDLGVGEIAGDGLRATYGLSNDVIGLFESFVGMGSGEDLFGLEIVGDAGQLSLRGGVTKRLLHYPRPYLLPGADDDRWTEVPVPDAEAGDIPGGAPPPAEAVFTRATQRLVLDLLRAVENDTEPASSGEQARAALELIKAVPAAHRAGGRVSLPLS